MVNGRPPRSIAERDYNIVLTDLPKGGHFAALEQPEQFLHEIQTFFFAKSEHKERKE